ncbi:EAL domain-containing protein [Anaerobacillus sp. CMMVII]|uniref:sensor domain-containing protein n=1 Tax=Anaerobacillus sp. CMMVII TaxID=2755588 RepID=UPI0021B766B7|nr:EAL domain-containing protein [Anaerobacillus sp. CMMVII]MCT8137424.1 EAL domain-containing protein [Anaerobacillus sp. CMMVII]
MMSKEINIARNITPTNLVSDLRKELVKLQLQNAEVSEILDELTNICYALDRSAIVTITDRHGNILSVNDKFCDLSKYTREELVGKNHNILKSGHHTEDFYKHMWKTITSGNVWEGEVKNRAKDGSEYWVKTAIFPLIDKDGTPYKYISVRTDITEGKLYEDNLRELLKDDFLQVMQSLDNFVFKLKKCSESRFVFTLIAGKLAKELGLIEEEHLNKAIKDIFPSDIYKKLLTPAEETFSGSTTKFEVRYKKRYLFVTLSPFYRNGSVKEIVGSVSDMTDLKNSELIVEHMAYHDSLTDLPNRRVLDKDISHLLVEAEAVNKQVAVLLIDLDHFKRINDTLGHAVGDYILIMAAHRLQKLHISKYVKRSTLYHLGGDEFVFVLYDTTEETVQQVCEYLLSVFESPFIYKQADIHLTISIGVSVFPSTGESPEDLVKNCDIALFAAKDKGRNTFQFYNVGMDESLLKKLEIENDLRKALALGDQLQLFYQPQLDLRKKAVVGLEALIRWFHPEKGYIPPLDFIQVAEDSGLIIPLGVWVLKEACTQLKKWQEQGFSDLRVSVNIATKHFQHPNFITDVARNLEVAQLSSQSLELEITENSLMDSTKTTIDTLKKIQALGIQIAIDDFGTGYSSMSYLKKFPISTLKIDQSFVSELPENNGDRAIVSSIINLAHNLGLRVVAEGVENQEALAYLVDENCDEMQGYFFSRPIPCEDVKTFLEKHVSNTMD